MSLMPVAKKTTNNKTNNKKQKTNLLQKLKLNTLKGRVLTTVLVFAIIGGGVMVYKSFAYTYANVWTYSRANNNLSTEISRGIAGHCGVAEETDAAKSTLKVIKLNCLGNGSTGLWVAASAVGVNFSQAQVGKKFQLCVNMKTVGNVTGSWLVDSTTTNTNMFGTPATNVLKKYNSSDYKEFCSDEGVLKQSGGAKAWFKLNGEAYDSTAYVSNLSIKEIGTPAGTPAPSK